MARRARCARHQLLRARWMYAEQDPHKSKAEKAAARARLTRHWQRCRTCQQAPEIQGRRVRDDEPEIWS